MKNLRVQILFLWTALALPLSIFAGTTPAATPRAQVVLTVSYIKDESGQLSAQQVAQRQDFVPTSHNASFGFTRAVVWLKIEMKGAQLQAGNRYLSVWPPRLEKVELFKMSKEVGGKVILIPQDKEYLKNGNVYYDAFKSTLFEIDSMERSATYLLKLESAFSLLTKVEVMDQFSINEHRTNVGFLIGAVSFGLIPFVFIFSFFSIKNKNPVYRSYLLNLFLMTVFFLSTIGFDSFVALQMKGPSLDEQVGFLTILSPLTTYLFVTHIGEILGVSPIKMARMRACVYALLVLSPSYFLLEQQVISVFFLCTNFALSAYAIFLSYKQFNRKDTSHMILLGVFLAINLAAINIFLTLLGVKSSSDDVLFTRAIRIAFVPFVLVVLTTHFEEKKNKELIALEVERLSAEKEKVHEIDRRQAYENFIAMLLHEIKTPLSIIQIAAGSLGRKLLADTPEHHRVDNIKQSVLEINQIFNKCMQVVDLENKTTHIDLSEFNIDFLTEDLHRALGTNRIVFRTLYNGTIHTDYVILKTILSNLLSNALKYGQEESEVALEISTHPSNDTSILFKVMNAPSNVGQPHPEKVFQRFYRSESAKKFTGSGQGLWLSQQLALMLNSRIEFHTTADQTCFTLVLTKSQNV